MLMLLSPRDFEKLAFWKSGFFLRTEWIKLKNIEVQWTFWLVYAGRDLIALFMMKLQSWK